MQCRTQTHEARLVDGVGRRDAVLLRQCQPVANVGFRVRVDESLLALGNVGVMRDVGGARVDDGPFDQLRTHQLVDRAESLRGGQRRRCVDAPRKRQRAVADEVGFGADALDDGRVDLVVVALPAADGVVGVEVDDRCPFIGAGEGGFDDLVGAHRDVRLAGPGPWSVEGDFKPDGFFHVLLLREVAGAGEWGAVARTGDVG